MSVGKDIFIPHFLVLFLSNLALSLIGTVDCLVFYAALNNILVISQRFLGKLPCSTTGSFIQTPASQS